MKDREGYNKGGDEREGGLLIDVGQTISRNLCLSVVHAFPPNVSCYHRIYFSFFFFQKTISLLLVMARVKEMSIRLIPSNR